MSGKCICNKTRPLQLVTEQANWSAACKQTGPGWRPDSAGLACPQLGFDSNSAHSACSLVMVSVVRACSMETRTSCEQHGWPDQAKTI